MVKCNKVKLSGANAMPVAGRCLPRSGLSSASMANSNFKSAFNFNLPDNFWNKVVVSCLNQPVKEAVNWCNNKHSPSLAGILGLIPNTPSYAFECWAVTVIML